MPSAPPEALLAWDFFRTYTGSESAFACIESVQSPSCSPWQTHVRADSKCFAAMRGSAPASRGISAATDATDMADRTKTAVRAQRYRREARTPINVSFVVSHGLGSPGREVGLPQ